jgi:acyl-CoA synthetase (NDP forming)/RimJ/RimL family protein N-acetyltransferase
VGYPEQWEADVVLKDGGTCHLRPIQPDDAPHLAAFHSRLSPETVYYRFFAPYPALSKRDLERFTNVDHHDRVALVATIAEQIIGVVRYERIAVDEAEVAFVIEDAHQGRGLGTIFLEHIAQAARERGIRRFTAEVLPDNARMLEVFEHAGWTPQSSHVDGYVSLRIDITPTTSSLAVSHAREQRAEASSIVRLVRARSVVVVGAGRDRSSTGHALVRHVVEGGFTGTVYAINPNADGEVAGVRCFRSLDDLPEPVDLALVATPASAVGDVVEQAAAAGAHSLVVVSTGFGESGVEGFAEQRRLVRSARARGMRVLGPAALGFVNTDPTVSLNASLAPHLPPRGPVGFFAQSGAPGAAMLEAAGRRGLGTSTFVSAGNRADISGNDLLQYWEDDEATDVVLLYLESIGNPRKFSRIARRVGARKPIVAVKTGRSTQGAPLGHSVRPTSLAPEAFEQLFEQVGVIRTDTVAEMYDVAELLVNQPLPQGGRVLSLSNSHAMTLMAQDAATSAGLTWIDPPIVFGVDSTTDHFERTLAGAVDDPAVDAILALYVPQLGESGTGVAEALQRVAARATKPIVGVVWSVEGQHPLAALGRRGRVPTYPAVEDAVRALAASRRYAAWRAHADETPMDLDDIDVEKAHALVTGWLGDGPVVLDDLQAHELLACYGIEVWPHVTALTVDEAAAAAAELGYPVVLKTSDQYLRLRSDLGGVFFDITDEDELRRQYVARLAELKPHGYDRLVVQRQAAPGASVVIETAEDELFGPVLSFGLAGVAYDVMRDRGYGVPPLTPHDIDGLLRRPAASALLEPAASGGPVDRAALAEMVARVSRLADDVPAMSRLTLRPVVVASEGLAVLGARVELAPPVGRTDLPARRLLG